MKSLPLSLSAQIARQAGLVSRQQLAEAAYDRRNIATQINAGCWMPITTRVISVGPSAWTRESELWLAALHYPNALLTAASGLEVFGLVGRLGDPIDIVSAENLRKPPRQNIRPHYCSRPETGSGSPQCVTAARAAVDAMRLSVSLNQACFYAIWAVQKRLVTLEEVRRAAQSDPHTNGMNRVVRALNELGQGIEAISELHFARLCKKFRIPTPDRQQKRIDSEGRTRYLDAVWERGAKTLIVEIDGLGHLEHQVRMDDQFRDNSMALQGSMTLRIPAIALRLEAERWMRQIQHALS